MNNKFAIKDGKKVHGYRDILYEVKDQVAWITTNRPRVMNAFREHHRRNDGSVQPSIAFAVVKFPVLVPEFPAPPK